MFKNELKDFIMVSKNIGNCPEYVQGGGGNTSVKINDELLAIKASGFKLSQISEKDGFVIVNYKKIKEFYESILEGSDEDLEKKCTENVRQNTVRQEGLKPLRPSVETGFHSILKKYVIHTHPVYVNILCCSRRGKEIVDKIFSGRDYTFLWIPYINPGFSLTVKIKEEIGKTINNGKKFPQVVFMENHGLIVTSDDSKECMELHEEVNSLIKSFFNITESYSAILLAEIDESTFTSKTSYLNHYMKEKGISEEYFEKNKLYPDQLVYLNGNISVNKMHGKLNINTSTGDIIYRCSLNEAVAMEEILTGYLYTIQKIEENELGLMAMSEKGADFINNWESEKYRKSLLKK